MSRLDELLRQIALIPPGAELPDLLKVYETVLASANRSGPRYVGGRGKSALIPDAISTEDALAKALELCLQGLDDLAEYIRSRSQDDERPPGAPWFWYMFIREASEKLRNVVQGRPVPGITVDPDGIIRAERDYFAEAVDEIDSTLLRVCARWDCQRIFFAKQGKSKYDTEKCRHVVANRLLRFLEKEGFSAGVNLTKKDKARKATLIREWKEQHGVPET